MIRFMVQDRLKDIYKSMLKQKRQSLYFSGGLHTRDTIMIDVDETGEDLKAYIKGNILKAII